MTEAVTCARNVTVPTRASSTTTVAPKTTTTTATNTTHKPTSIPGSRYPERIQTMEVIEHRDRFHPGIGIDKMLIKFKFKKKYRYKVDFLKPIIMLNSRFANLILKNCPGICQFRSGL